ncbi:MAG: ABC transporter permease [Bacteroidetes bacterium]|nr:ABC transporter permease [Bacteroidota bacterium]
MLQNYIKTAFRNLWRYKGYTAINILGMAIGMACVILIMLYVQSETNFDTFHPNESQLYRVNIQITNPQTGDKNQRAIGPYRLADELAADFSDFKYVARLAPQGNTQVEYQNQQFQEENFAFADPEFLQMLHFPLIKGNKETALDDPFSVVLTASSAQKYFGDEDPIGKILRIRDRDFAVSGVLEEIPENTQFGYDMLASMNCADQVFSRIVLENWGEGYCTTLVMLDEGKTAELYTERLARFTAEKLPEWSAASPIFVLQPLSKVYLHSQDISSFESGGDITYVYAFSFIAIFILIIACINFMNLATARSSLRAREVGVRKVFGANRSQLIRQFLSESILLAVISLVLAVIIAKLAMPTFQELAGKENLTLSFSNWSLLTSLLTITVFVGVIAGSYPALILSAFKPVTVFSGNTTRGLKGGGLRKVLVSFQFATSIFLIIVTGIVYKQLQYSKNIKLGFDKEHVLIISGTPMSLRENYDQFRTELMKNPQVVNAAASSRVPPGRLSSNLTARPEGVPEDQQRGMQTVWTDFDFIETLGLEIATGRSFSRDFPTDAREGFIINEAAVKDLGWTNEEAINKTFGSSEITDWNAGQWQLRDGRVIGVLKNFHFESLKNRIVPTVYFVAPYMAWNYVVRLRGERLQETIAHVEKTWNQFNPDAPFEYSFMDENFARLYQTEERQGTIFAIFAVLAIMIACLGLVGLTSFTAERKKKEIGIRKVLGASSLNLIVLLSREFTILVLIAFAIASPIAWYVMDGWLQEFAYRSPIGIMLFVLAGISAVVIAWIAAGFQTARAAATNPVNALRDE